MKQFVLVSNDEIVLIHTNRKRITKTFIALINGKLTQSQRIKFDSVGETFGKKQPNEFKIGRIDLHVGTELTVDGLTYTTVSTGGTCLSLYRGFSKVPTKISQIII